MTTHLQRPRTPPDSTAAAPLTMRGARLQKHADYQRVYKSSRKHFAPTMAYFFTPRTQSLPAQPLTTPKGPRVGLTAGKVLGNAVERNRIKRRMREAVRRHVALLPAGVDVILHPRKSVLTIEFERLDREVERIFTTIQQALATLPAKEPQRRPGP
ncbi:MAG TPA: ribonuclease P protein component [Acidisarcina sp.]|nr:ribonuclease P protein component [Acidisarcina sp.]